MLFNSLEFALFLPLVFLGYWFVFQKNLKLQNLFILAVSYLFYGWWDWRFLILIALTSWLSYTTGKLIAHHRDRTPKTARQITIFNVIVNLAILGYFKYANFFVDSFTQLLHTIGLKIDPITLQIILPVGISFYTFQALSYTIDIYRRKLEPTHNWVSFFAYVAFFPQLVAGPIERATHLLPQFYRPRTFHYTQAADGLWLILFGLFKKIAVADKLAHYVNPIFADHSQYDSSAILIAVLFFTFQIYCDFSGYSDIARGVAKWFGFDLMVNFNKPYFATSFHTFWARWHISLTTWFKDYLYIPLGGNRRSTTRTYLNILIVFLISGLWHGANWTFLVWGLIHGLFQIIERLFRDPIETIRTTAIRLHLAPLHSLLSNLSVFTIVAIAWIFFRADNLHHATQILHRIFSNTYHWQPSAVVINLAIGHFAASIIALLSLLLLDAADNRIARPKQRFLLSILLIILICFFGQNGEAQFIYFQF